MHRHQAMYSSSLSSASRSSLSRTVERACARIAPTWPLDRFIAVNPCWGFVDTPLPEVAARLAAWSGIQLLMPRAWYREQWRMGRFGADHLSRALEEMNSPLTVEQWLARLEADSTMPPRRASIIDVADANRDLVHEMSWREFIVQVTSEHCAAYFDDGQASLSPLRKGGLYATWRLWARADHRPTLQMGLSTFQDDMRELPDDPLEMIATALVELDVPESEHETYLTMLLLDVNGWAAWCAYLRWMARFDEKDDDHVVDLLAIRIAWEWMLHRAGGRNIASRWQMAMANWRDVDAKAEALIDDWALQRAAEIAYQDEIRRGLSQQSPYMAPNEPVVQVVFCIDVRSEVFRRALEAQHPDIQTLGFAGFFGAPLEYRPTASPHARPQLPGLLAPRLRATDANISREIVDRRTFRLDWAQLWKQFRTNAVSGFSFVETMGLFYAGKLWALSAGTHRPVEHPEKAGLSEFEHAQRKPRLATWANGEALDIGARCDLAANILRGMSLTHHFARLVTLVGHGSETVNNPHAAGLDCGACCGQTGEVNARAVAALLNDPDVRDGLAVRNIEIPPTTHFIAGLHNTTTDDVQFFDLDELPATHAGDVAALKTWLTGAGARARAERAAPLGLAHLEGEALHQAMRARGRDSAQVRPEWGLAGNACFIVAPRERCSHMDLQGRSFLHEYRHEEDPNFSTLELIMTAPMIVTHWINFQYYASTVDNVRFGSGNKVLHNVVGGHLGVFEGNGGDLRIGLPLQSLHDGNHWLHSPLRLSVFIEAPREAIEAILLKHTLVRNLIQHEWIHLFQIDEDKRKVYAYRSGSWC